jgi:hypothetical protein
MRDWKLCDRSWSRLCPTICLCSHGQRKLSIFMLWKKDLAYLERLFVSISISIRSPKFSLCCMSCFFVRTIFCTWMDAVQRWCFNCREWKPSTQQLSVFTSLLPPADQNQITRYIARYPLISRSFYTCLSVCIWEHLYREVYCVTDFARDEWEACY